MSVIPFTKIQGKKAQRDLITYGIIFLIMLAFSIYFIVQWQLNTEKHNTEEICRNSVKLASYKISGKSVYENLKCPTQYQTIEPTDDEAIKKEVAERMRICWWMFLEGKAELFEEEAEHFCVVCYVLDFKEKKKIPGFVNYLSKTDIPLSSDVTYYNYLAPHSTSRELAEEEINVEQDFIDTNQRYAVVFNYVKPSYISKLEAGEIGGAAGTGAGVAGLFGGVALLNLIPWVNIATIPITVIGGAAGVGGFTGFIIGYQQGVTADWSASVILWPYTEEEMQRLQCEYAPVETK